MQQQQQLTQQHENRSYPRRDERQPSPPPTTSPDRPGSNHRKTTRYGSYPRAASKATTAIAYCKKCRRTSHSAKDCYAKTTVPFPSSQPSAKEPTEDMPNPQRTAHTPYAKAPRSDPNRTGLRITSQRPCQINSDSRATFSPTVNPVTENDIYPLLLVVAHLQNLSRFRYFVKIDLSNGYGYLTRTVLAQELKQDLSIFQRYMDHVLVGLPSSHIDDISIGAVPPTNAPNSLKRIKALG
ncbi:hypothetical protein DFJ73DRAFT_797713 [Zopfochytrium polystomum]|nr:hypothetical protein DFJ73DRAFT_797713 [Zopfochytrium polystomum]